MASLALMFIAFSGGTYFLGTAFLRRESSLHDSKLIQRTYRH